MIPMSRQLSSYGRATLLWAVASTVIMEAVTVYLRFGLGRTAAEFNQTAPLLLQIHHMFWSVPVFLVAIALGMRKASSAWWGLGYGLIASDLAHHFLILPLTVGNLGWHWP